MSLASRVLLGVCFVTLSGCSGCDKGDPEGGASGKSSRRADRPLRADGVAAPPLRAMRQRLNEEADARPPVPLQVEATFAAFEKDGIKLERKRQQLGTPYLASFCTSAHTGVKIQLTVCEHESEERADENVKALQKLERPERRIAKNGTTTLLVRRDLNDEAEAPLVDKLIRTFEHLGPAPVDP